MCWKADIALPTKIRIVKTVISPVVTQLWEQDCKEGRSSKNYCLWTVVLEKIPESPLNKEIKPVNLKANQPWMFIGRIDAEAPVFWSPDAKLTHWKSSRCWEGLRAEREESNRGLNGWMASLMQWTWTWANSGRWWGTGRPGMLQSMGLQRVRWLGDWTRSEGTVHTEGLLRTQHYAACSLEAL